MIKKEVNQIKKIKLKEKIAVDFGNDSVNNSYSLNTSIESNPFMGNSDVTPNEYVNTNTVIDTNSDNVFFGNDNNKVETESFNNESNPFVGNYDTNDVDANDNSFSLEKNPFGNATFDDNILGNNNFWDNAYEDGGLDTLPDLPTNGEMASNNFFANNRIIIPYITNKFYNFIP